MLELWKHPNGLYYFVKGKYELSFEPKVDGGITITTIKDLQQFQDSLRTRQYNILYSSTHYPKETSTYLCSIPIWLVHDIFDWIIDNKPEVLL